jgi:LysM domain
MKRLAVLLCALALYAPVWIARAQEASHNDGTSFDDLFGSDEAEAEEESPESLAEARRQGKAYRIGTGGIAGLGRKPERDVHVVQEGDTLWDISDKYFGDPYHWPELWSFNPEITNPHWIYPLDQVRLTTETFQVDQAEAQAQAAAAPQGEAAKAAPGVFVEPKQTSFTELAPRVTISPKMLHPQTVFLRDEGYLDDDAIKASAQIIGGNEEQMFLSNSDEVYLKFKQGQSVQPGQQFTVYRQIYERERDPGEKGTLVRILGTVLVRSYDAKNAVARGLITESMEPIERGMFVTHMDRRFDIVPPQRNESNVVAHIIATTQPRKLVYSNQVAFLDVGEGHGIKPGNRFFAVRRGDNWMDVLQRPPMDMGNIVDIPEYNKDQLPKEVVAELRVIKVRKKVTIALITRSDTDLVQGETVEMRQGF